MKIIAADNLSGSGLDMLRDAFGDGLVQCGKLAGDELADALRTADALIVRSGTTVSAADFEHADAVKVIGRAGVGVDNIDLDAATAAGVIVMNTPYGNYVSAAEQALALMFAAARNIARADATMKQHAWEKKQLAGVELMGKTLGLVGLGKVGGHVARVATAMGMTVLAHDPFLTEEQARKVGVEPVDLDDLLARADVVSLHCPLTDQTADLLDADAFGKMRDGVIVVNCARGGIVNEQALADAVASGKIRAAGVDVFAEEPCTEGPLFGPEAVTLSPHLGASTAEAQDRVGRDIAEQLIAFFKEGCIVNAVNVSVASDPALQPFTDICRILGTVAGHLGEEAPREVEITCAGDIASRECDELAASVVQGLLSVSCAENVNIVNAMYLARDRGLSVTTSSRESAGTYRSRIDVRVSGAAGDVTVSGTVFDGVEPRIIAIDGYRTELQPAPHLLFMLYPDKPGMVGHIGAILGSHDINIAGMEVGRDKPRGEAVVVLTLDDPVPAEVLAELEREVGMRRVQYISL